MGYRQYESDLLNLISPCAAWCIKRHDPPVLGGKWKEGKTKSQQKNYLRRGLPLDSSTSHISSIYIQILANSQRDLHITAPSPCIRTRNLKVFKASSRNTSTTLLYHHTQSIIPYHLQSTSINPHQPQSTSINFSQHACLSPSLSTASLSWPAALPPASAIAQVNPLASHLEYEKHLQP